MPLVSAEEWNTLSSHMFNKKGGLESCYNVGDDGIMSSTTGFRPVAKCYIYGI